MVERLPRLWSLLERLLPWLVLALLLLFTYAYFFAMPYIGFRYSSTGQVVELYVNSAGDAGLQREDQLVQVGPVLWRDFYQDFRQMIFAGAQPGDVVNLIVERVGRRLTIPWTLPGPTSAELLQRLNNEWFLAYFFWLAGSLVLLSVRPKDARWRLLGAFCFLTALWLVTGSGAAAAHVWSTALVLQAAAWLSVPVYWHFHWVFPRPLRSVPRLVGWLLYGAAALLAIAQFLGLISAHAYAYGLLLAVGGAVLLVFLHVIFQTSERQALRGLFFAVVLALAPLLVVGLIESAGVTHAYFAGGAALLALPVLPFGYFFGLSRGHLGGMELRRNRLLALYLFAVVLGMALITGHAILEAALKLPSVALPVGVTAGLLTALVTIYVYGPFQRLVERRLLGVPSAPTRLLETYAARIATRLNETSLVGLLRDVILPGLLVRQSALLHFDEAQSLAVLYQTGLTVGTLPTEADVSALVAHGGQERRLQTDSDVPSRAWVRLVLPLRVDERLIGLWLLGHRDPDDAYDRPEIGVLQALADQTAVALAHIVQSQLLRAAYKADVDRMETERASLARELHDSVLGDLAELKGIAETDSPAPAFLETYDRVVTNLRQIITGLRPVMLNYGLRAALSSLADALSDRAGANPVIELAVPESQARYNPDLEQHLYRIVQQACENALRHARAQRIKIHGHMELDSIDLTVDDDGVGFKADERLDLAGLIANRHFGLAGMHERATLIQANLSIQSVAGQGTGVRITWANHPS
jgi:signal transduction histidine kinase